MGELRASTGIWLISIATLASAIFLLGRVGQPNIELPEIPKEGCASAVFIGSSLTASGILVDQATTATDEHRTELSATCILSLPAISELETLFVIEHAVTWQPSIIFVEINALATDARGIKNIPYASNLIERWLAVQHQMARSLKTWSSTQKTERVRREPCRHKALSLSAPHLKARCLSFIRVALDSCLGLGRRSKLPRVTALESSGFGRRSSQKKHPIVSRKLSSCSLMWHHYARDWKRSVGCQLSVGVSVISMID